MPDLVWGLFINLIYYVLMEGCFGRTVGKILTATKVGNETGEKPGFGAVLGRSLCRFIPFEAFSLPRKRNLGLARFPPADLRGGFEIG